MIDEIEALKEDICFVTYIFPDNSRIAICTTLNRDILEKYGGSLIKGAFYDLIKKRYVNFNYDVANVIVSESSPNLREVDKFANQFI